MSEQKEEIAPTAEAEGFVEGVHTSAKMDISAGLQKEGDVLKTPVDGVSTRTVNLAKGLEVVSPQKPSSRKGIVSLTRGLTELSEEENASDNTPLGTDVDMKSILAKLQGSEMVSDSPSKAEAWEKKADAANQAEVIPSEEVLKSLGLTSAAVEEGWEQKQHEHGSAAVADASDIFSKLGLTDVNVAEAWEVKK